MKKLFLYLPFAGTLPFIAGTILISLNIEQIPILGNVKTAFITYGILICGFMAGAHWGQSLGSNSRATLYLPVFSNTLTITLWFGATLLGFFPVMILLAVLFCLLLGIDWYLQSQKQISASYFRTRCLVTSVVLTTLCVSGAFGR